jgi:pyridoxal 5'-phosphate synthase pdxS subunit
MIKEIMAAVSIPVMAKVRIGHTVEAQILQAVGVDYIDVRRLAILSTVCLHALTRAGVRSLDHGGRPAPHW